MKIRLLPSITWGVSLLYPLIVYAGFRAGYYHAVALLVVFFLGLRVHAAARRYFSSGVQGSLAVAGGVALIVGIIVSVNPQASLFFPACINAVMCAVFALSFLTPRNVIERVAILMEGSMPPEGRRYCAKVCVVWIVFFALNATLAFDSVFRSLEWWGLYNGCISYCCIAFLVLAELLVRRRVKSRARKQVSLACLLVLVCSVPLPNAHGGLYAEPQAVSDTTARLERIRSRLAPPGPFVADFTEKRFIAVLTEPLESRGIMRCIPGQGLVWETQSPVQRSSTITQQGITEVHGSSAVTTATDSTRVSQVLLSLLSGSVDNSSDYFDLYVSGNETQWEIRLVPRDDLVRQVISIVSIRGSLRPQQLEVAHASGDRVVTSFSEPRLLTKHEIEQAQEALKRAS